ncbi:hybrid sensor histidine kinase/response regulator [Ghiorsea bivora]|uniref:hybrid sensor histidine kinase/response regulator n=1 Tax=Ghiorsea bivora TaxID=1485545 RepID=UPI0006909173|nr:PAS domain-containing hybrid sensor histidine kinase/response regulator [Ghiorsea bivora]
MSYSSKEELQLQQNYRLIEALEATKKRYEALFQFSGAAIMTLKDKHFVDCNQAALDMFGFSSKQIFYQFTPAQLSPELQPDGAESQVAADMHMKAAVEQGKTSFEWVHKRLDGSEFPANVQLSFIQVGDHYELQAVVTDLSEVKKAEKLKLASETKFRKLLDFLPDGIGVNVGGKLVYANPALTMMLGFKSPDEIIGTIMLDYIHPDDRKLAVQRKQQVIETGQPISEIEERFLRKNGEVFTGTVVSEPVEFGEQRGVLVVIRDISALKASQEKMVHLMQAAERSAKHLREAQKVAHIGSWELDSANNKLWWSEEVFRIFEIDSDESPASYDAFLESVHPEDSDMLDAAFTKHLEEKVPYDLTHRLQFVDDSGKERIKFVHERCQTTFDEAGKPLYSIGTVRDITEERQQQEKMEHVQRLESLGVLAGGIAHDFNNILTAIMGHSAIAKGKSDVTNTTTEHLAAIEGASQRAADLCKQMLAYSGKGKFVVQPVNLSELVEEMIRLLEVSIHKSVVMRYEMTPNLPAIEADLAQMQQVIMNLVINANEAIGERSGNVSIATGVMWADEDYLQSTYLQEEQLKLGRYVYLEVSDTGCGMDEETKKRLFEPFFTTKFTGRGLGMSAILGIVRGHHGVIKVYSEQGKGSTLKILFPVVDQEAVPLQRETKLQEDQHCGTVLIVDDEESIREIASIMLEDVGYHTITAVDGLDAVEKLKQHANEVDCVLLDMTMPRMGGEDAFTEMRRICPEIKVVLSSGYNQQIATQRFTGKGLAGFVQKPYMPDELLSKLTEVLAS